MKPNVEEIKEIIDKKIGNTIPVYLEIPSDLLTPVAAYLKITHNNDSYSFLLESVIGGEKLGRYSFIGFDPYKIRISGPTESIQGDPLIPLEQDFKDIRYVPVKGIPNFTGGAIGYVSYDCVRHFEPRTNRPLKDVLQLPESILMYCDTLIVFDHLHQLVKIVSHYRTNDHPESVNSTSDQVEDFPQIRIKYEEIQKRIVGLAEKLNSEYTPLPPIQKDISLTNQNVSNKGKEGYEQMVRNLKKHIMEGDIIQAVPSQRVTRPTNLHPLNLYRRLRSVNPSPYMFYVDFKDFQLVGASPEALVKVENKMVETHPIAGTRKRGATPEEDEALAKELLADEKELAEHVMLVDLGRNDVNRVCEPKTVVVDSFMHIEKYSHVMHIVSRVKGVLRKDKTSFDAFRSIFPAGTVSGAPKVRAIELISEQEEETRGVYAGAVGYFGYSGDLDTCIAIRTMVLKDGNAYLQAGAGIVFDSDPTSEFIETENKLRSNLTAIATAEAYYASLANSNNNKDNSHTYNYNSKKRKTE